MYYTLHLSQAEALIIQEALAAISPSGGGSKTYTLLRHIRSVTGLEEATDRVLGHQATAAKELEPEA